MTVSDATVILAVAIIMNYLVLARQHPFLSGILTVLLGASTYLVQASSNPYGVVIIAIGIVQTFSAPWGGGK